MSEPLIAEDGNMCGVFMYGGGRALAATSPPHLEVPSALTLLLQKYTS